MCHDGDDSVCPAFLFVTCEIVQDDFHNGYNSKENQTVLAEQPLADRFMVNQGPEDKAID